jgi:acetyl-CoA carboxylase biotin carboxylase subunit
VFKRVLVANRGEIAVRVISALREMGIVSIAVYSDVDRAGLHVRRADEAYFLGPAPANESYLNIPRILEAARQGRAEAIHPGYGFLSESARFARACAEAGFKFIGPPPEAMEIMGNKTAARRAMERAGVPMVPGSSRGLSSLEEAEQVAESVGYPVMLKAAAGGGGKGMRLVRHRQWLPASLQAAHSEALRAFGDDEVYVEKYISDPRHIEVQVLADEYGHCVHLGERECSLQRRHQKVLEESPSPLVDPEMRRRMGEIAVRAAQAAGYTNAGTVEFLSDQDKNFYFLEMNTRLQVEHPVTEFVTGLDLVHLQLRIAAGEELPFTQEEIAFRGHAMECRIYAEDPDNNFFPSPGRIGMLEEPSGPWVRVDSGIYEGWNVPLEYDPLLAKLIVYGADREQCMGRLRRAVSDYFVGGIKTNLGLFRRILEHPEFLRGRLDTGLLDRLLQDGPVTAKPNGEGAHVAALAVGIFAALEPSDSAATPAANGANGRNGAAPRSSNWKMAGRWDALRSTV